ncbi:MAG: hypothetical protein U0744_07485 [Gemmataceae bacterium]
MSEVDWPTVRTSLIELSDVAMQRKLRLSDGGGGRYASSFREAVEQLYTDSGLTLAMMNDDAEIDLSIRQTLFPLEEELQKIDVRDWPSSTISDPFMDAARRLSSQLLSLIP